MAKKILYKTIAYHCPRCGGVTEPTKKYCDYCSRDLLIRSENHNKNKFRLLIDCGNFVFFDSLMNVEFFDTPSFIETTTLEDTRRSFIQSAHEYRIVVDMPFCKRTSELRMLNYKGLHKIRFEHLGLDTSYEQECYISDAVMKLNSNKIARQRISFVGVGNHIIGTAIPKEVMDEMRCPNCGAPIKSRYGACDFCSGWSEVEF